MSFGNAMAVVSVDPASGASMSAAQVKAALVSKYGTTEGDAINAQFEQTVTDSDNNCAGPAGTVHGTRRSPGTDSRPGRDIGVIVHRGLREPGRSGESGWLAQVQGALQNVQQDLNNISSDSSDNPDNLAVDGSQLEWTRRPPWTPITTRPRLTTPTGPPR